jgi:hypothetical protein
MVAVIIVFIAIAIIMIITAFVFVSRAHALTSCPGVPQTRPVKYKFQFKYLAMAALFGTTSKSQPTASSVLPTRRVTRQLMTTDKKPEGGRNLAPPP